MKISELRKREAYDEGLLSTLHAGVERMEKLGWDLPCGDKNVQWYLHPFFSVYVTESFGEAGRHFLREQYAHAPRVMRRIAQRLCVDVLSMGGCFGRHFSRRLSFAVVRMPVKACGCRAITGCVISILRVGMCGYFPRRDFPMLGF